MAKTKTALRTALRNSYLEIVEKHLNDEGIETIRVPLSSESLSDGYQLAVPALDEERNEETVLIYISVPRGTRNGEPYNPYEEHERYKENLAAKKDKEEKRAEEKARKEADKQRKQEARKAKKEAAAKKNGEEEE